MKVVVVDVSSSPTPLPSPLPSPPPPPPPVEPPPRASSTSPRSIASLQSFDSFDSFESATHHRRQPDDVTSRHTLDSFDTITRHEFDRHSFLPPIQEHETIASLRATVANLKRDVEIWKARFEQASKYQEVYRLLYRDARLALEEIARRRRERATTTDPPPPPPSTIDESSSTPIKNNERGRNDTSLAMRIVRTLVWVWNRVMTMRFS